MKKILFASLALLSLNVAFAGGRDSGGTTPLGVSGSQVQAIFGSPEIWRTFAGPMKSVKHLRYVTDGTVFAFETFHVRDVKDARGAVIEWVTQVCAMEVTVTAPSEANDASSGVGGWNVAVGAAKCVDAKKKP